MSEPTNVAKRLRACTNSDAVAREALSILIESTGAKGGFLFCRLQGRLQLVASSTPATELEELRSVLDAFLQRELHSDITTTALEVASLPPLPKKANIAGLNADVEPMLLLGRSKGEPIVAGVAALHYEGQERRTVRRAVLEAVTSALVAANLAEAADCAY